MSVDLTPPLETSRRTAADGEAGVGAGMRWSAVVLAAAAAVAGEAMALLVVQAAPGGRGSGQLKQWCRSDRS